MTEVVLVAIITSGSAVISATVTAVGAVWVKRNVWQARHESHGEHRDTADKVDEIHGTLGRINGGLDKLIEEKVAKALEERG